MIVEVYVTPKKGVLDPQGKAVAHGLNSLGFNVVKDARVGKLITLKLEGGLKKDLNAEIEEMCKKLLANTVIEDFSFSIKEA
ncbi:MAG: phosphoribosylformylglycinamidine synthase [Deltaproteobacteria bacterium RIFCSPHIGHO2_12_FULL_43_9]|nr:MAG: phosphoribosylformylglycinamidine synthase [Deltaproteobacteria bacterium RIFCSPHIGHO2_12_FULL_43_9]